MILNPVKIPERKISSVDIPKFDAGLFLNGPQNAPINSMVDSKDVEIDNGGFLVPRRRLAKFLPDTVGVSYQKFPVLWNGQEVFFTADDGKIKHCLATDSDWTDCTGSNSFSTNNGGMTKFLRALNRVIILNGKNGDKLSYVDLETPGFPVVKYVPLADPSTAPTAALTNLTAGSDNIYYAFNYSSTIGETKLSPIQTVSINKTRDEWTGMTSPGSITITRTGTPPAGATYWNIYIALSAPSGGIADEDMLLLAAQLEISSTTFVDNGNLAINLGAIPPSENSTEGPMVDQGIIANGTPILFADQESPYNIWIGGSGPNAMNFSVSGGGYRYEAEKGTNFFPSIIVGFRNGQGIPSLTVYYSNTEGLSKQAVLEQNTVNYGDISLTLWGATEQYYGAAGVASSNSTVNYNGRLLSLSTDGFVSTETEASLQNVLSIKKVSTPVDDLVRSIKTSAMENVVGTGWGNKYMWLVPSRGFDTPQEILVLDTNQPGTDGKGAWYTMAIPANWIGVVSSPESEAFVYVSQGKETYKLIEASSTFDFINGVAQPFSTKAVGALSPMGGSAHNNWQASVQAMFYIVDLIGAIRIGVTYRNQSGNLKTKSRLYQGPIVLPSTLGGWGDPHWTYANMPQMTGWGASAPISSEVGSSRSVDVRIPVRIDDITNEMQWFLETDIGYNNYKLRAVSYEGMNIGIKPDLT